MRPPALSRPSATRKLESVPHHCTDKEGQMYDPLEMPEPQPPESEDDDTEDVVVVDDGLD
jgi:hypothetical protein